MKASAPPGRRASREARSRSRRAGSRRGWSRCLDLAFDHPTLFAFVPGSDDRAALVLEHAGRIQVVEGIGGEARQRTLLDLRGRVKPGGATGLLGLAFSPEFRENRRYFIQYQIEEKDEVFTLIEERTMKPDRLEDSGIPAREVIRIPAATLDHCGGSIAFGADGYLYFGMGDTGPHRDPEGHGQDMGLLLGKMLRIDVDGRDAGARLLDSGGQSLSSAVKGVRPEIWASGFRNPYRFSWDLKTGELWVADVGQDKWDEVAIVRRGENHGWNVLEGHHPFSETYPAARRDLRAAGHQLLAPARGLGDRRPRLPRDQGTEARGMVRFRRLREPPDLGAPPAGREAGRSGGDRPRAVADHRFLGGPRRGVCGDGLR